MAITMPDKDAIDIDAHEADRPHVHVVVDRCAGCQECVIRCPVDALDMDPRRWVAVADDERCVGCRQCVRTCPFSAIVVTGPALAGTRATTEVVHPEPLFADVGEVRRGLHSWEQALAEAQRCLSCPDPTCVRGCPAHNDIPGFIAAIAQQDLTTAHGILRRTSVLPDICSRVCNQSAQCEGACTWSLAGEAPVAIGQLERFVTEMRAVPPPERSEPIDLSVAVVGAGPGGIGAAWALAEAGASVTVYEKDPVPAGLLGWGIPDFTLPEAVANRPWRQLQEAGVDLRCGVEVDAAGLDRLLAAHDAVIVATGASVPVRLPIPGADLDGVTDATTFLKTARRAFEHEDGIPAWLSEMGLDASGADETGADETGADASGANASGANASGRRPHVLVLGAGNTAMDVARTARRLGLDATCVDWLDERFSLARPDELTEAREEGVSVRFARTVSRLEGDGGRVRRAWLTPTRQERRDRPPTVLHDVAAEGATVDLVVMAMGYRADPAVAAALPGTPVRREAHGLADRHWTASGVLHNPASAFAYHNPVGTLALGREVGLEAASLPVRERLWVIGDALVGPATVVEAMAQGRRAAATVLAARPARPGHQVPGRSRRALVCYASEGGRTAAVARRIAEELTDKGLRVRVLPIERVGAPEIASADLLVIGTWVKGFVVAKVGPPPEVRAWLDGLPRLGGMPVALFCTYGVDPRSTLGDMAGALERRGARVVATSALRRGGNPVASVALARRTLAGVRELEAAAAGATVPASPPPGHGSLKVLP